MKKVTISCPEHKKPSKVCDLIKDKSGIIRMEIKFPGCPEKLVVELNDYLKKLGVKEIN